MKGLLKFTNVTLKRGGNLLFEGLDLELGAGERLQVTGPNGCGKSSLIRLAAGLLRPEHGHVERSPVALADDQIALDRELLLRNALGFWGGAVEQAMVALRSDQLAEVPVRLLSSGQLKRATLARVAASHAAAPASRPSTSIPWRAAGSSPTADSSLVRPPTQSYIGNRASHPSPVATASIFDPGMVIATKCFAKTDSFLSKLLFVAVMMTRFGAESTGSMSPLALVRSTKPTCCVVNTARSRAKSRASSTPISPVNTASRVRSSALAMCGPTGTARSLPRRASLKF